MKICPKCGREFGNSSIRCPICKVDLELMREARRTSVNAGTGKSTTGRTSTYHKEAARTEAIQQQRVAPSKKEPEIPSGPSALSIIALIFSLIGCFAFIGAILAIVDLCIKDGKKKVCSILALVFCGIWLAILGLGSLASKDSEKEVNRRVETNSTEADGNINSKEYEELDNNINIQKNNDIDTHQEAAENEMNVEVLAEYTISDGIGWYTRRFMIIKNNSNETVDVSTSSLAYSSDGTMVGADDSDFYALGAGCTSVLYEAFETDSDISYYEGNMKVKRSEYYESVIQDLSYVQNNVDDGAIFQVTNNGSEPADFVEGYVLFFKNGQLVHYESSYFTDDDSELKPGETISKQITSYEEFDSMQFYLTGRR